MVYNGEKGRVGTLSRPTANVDQVDMKQFIRQTDDPELDMGLKETRPFFLFLIVVLIFLYGISLYSLPELRKVDRLIPYTTLFVIHIALHWSMPYLVIQRRRLLLYLVVQVVLVILLILISRETGVAIGLFIALAGETIGILEDWRRSLIAAIGYLALMGLTYGLIWGWDTLRGWLGGTLLVMVFVFVYVLMFLRQLNARAESQRLLEELQETHKQLAEYTQQVETLTMEAERQRMARELHDTLAQGLAGLVLQLEALEVSLERGNKEKAAQIAGQAKERARSTLAEARQAIYDLRINDLSLAETVAREVERFTTATGIPCALDMSPASVAAEQHRDHVVRCVSEGLANITRHAQATQVWVSIRENEDQLHITVRDNGRGFDSGGDMTAGHYGLLGLRERARLANGQLTMESEPGKGTTLQMTLPAQAGKRAG